MCHSHFVEIFCPRPRLESSDSQTKQPPSDTRSRTVETCPTVTDNQHNALLPRRSSQNIADSEEEEAISNPLKDVLLRATYASYKMPATAWGSLILSHLIFKFDDLRSGGVIVYAMPQALALSTSIALQVILINFLRNTEYEAVTDSHCNQEVWLGSITCACILGAAVFA